jgi:hypothetical protein
MGPAPSWNASGAGIARVTVPFNDWDAEGRLKPGVTGHSPFMRTER